MIFARLCITQAPTAVPTVADADEALPPYPHSQSSRLTGRLSVLEDSLRQQAFDTVQLCFRGIIASSVGGKSAVEDIITLTDIKTVSDFHAPSPTSTGRNDSQKAPHAPFYFELPTTISSSGSTKLRALPLTSRISGTTRLASTGGLNDTRTIRGECNISYWIEAQFQQAGKQVGFLSEPVKIAPSLYTPRLRASIANTKSQPLTILAKPDLLSRCKIAKTPALSVTLYEPDMAISTDPATNKRSITLPLAISMDLNGKTAVDARQSVKCSADIKWEVHTRFSPTANNGRRSSISEVVHKSTTASVCKSSILFRPLPQYENTQRKSYVATSQLDLAVPDAVSQPTLQWGHLSRTYALDMTLAFHGLQGAPKYTLHSSIPLNVTATGGRNAGPGQDMDMEILKDDIVISVAEAEGESDTDEETDPNPPPFPGTSTTPQTQPQTVLVRQPTPPPPYFR
ncbi:hypothetical protein LTR10_014363 [Elasticomyces elasticus]|uniref:LDB19 N-terminal domain-containing protein n=1 Tax=Exophiala sideris TaxID=1016849 RepID=A0ABR0J121_9EURO|nr:hypothetical protein LTR10_014363 [Elasticomyces elasticus]KAK5023724.1 hypothetical protein LTS07_009232 [Exophiala sideris]KAK5029723.1 hypothetical protein LTR13_008643 [Exophiala sideris]KAK5053513.1 hypothetical protein LTR69_009471 [Exophiala sideris]KAK5179271.1 hypothetical protein LTR44_008425 [Eurotiomycetes sp. CCFEE 6388]